MKKILASRISTFVLIALVTVLGIHVIAQNGENARADLTADNLYSLSEGTREILEKMQQEGIKPIRIKLYFSETAGKTLPKFIKDFITYETYLEALLREYEVASDGKIRVQFIDPVPDSDEAQDATDYGLDGKPINQHGDLFFFGLVFQTQTGSRDVIDFLWPNQQESIEYEISKHIHNLIWPQQKRIGVLSSLRVVSEATNPYMAQILAAQGKDPGESWIAMKLLEESYQVSKIDTDTDHIPRDEYDLVVVIHPKNLNDRALWALDEWITTGGNTLIFLDPYALNDIPPRNPQQPWLAYQYKPSSNLERLLAQWGLERKEDQVAADFELGITRAVSMRGQAERVIIDLGIDPETSAETLDTTHPIMRGLNNLRFFLAGSLEKLEGAEEKATLVPLITTTAGGNTLEIVPGFPGDDKKLVFNDANNPGKLRDAFDPERSKTVVLAYLVQGRLEPLFPDGADVPGEPPPPPAGLPPGIDLPPQESDEIIHKDPVPEDQRKEATVLVFADVDFISDQVAFQNTPFGAIATNDNHKVLLNAVDYLFGSEELMKVRSKKTIRRPFTLFDDIEEQADVQTRERERELRAEVERFQNELRDKQGSVSARNAALFQKQLQDEIDELNERIEAANAELREIRKAKRAALEGEETWVRLATLGATPSLVLVLGVFLLFRRKVRDFQARRSAS